MSTTDEARIAAFRADLAALGCHAPFEVNWAAGHATSPHTHDYRARGLVVEGAFTLTTPDGPRLIRAGEDFDLPAGTEHCETVGAMPTRLLAARLPPA